MRRLLRVVPIVLALALLVSGPAGAEPRKVIIKGGGWGHGIGMSQYGTYGRALRGDGSTKILEHYYTGSKVTPKNMGAIRVGLLQSRSTISFSSKPFRSGGGLLVFRSGGEKLAQGGTEASFRIEPSSTGGLKLFKNGEQIRRDGRRVFGDPTTPIVIRYSRHDTLVHVNEKSTDYAYGHLEVGTYQSDSCGPGFCARLVAEMPMQKYVYGLGEVPASWPDAALRTQAIAGRTYAYEKIRRLGQHRYPCDCAVYDSTIDQVYAGDGKRTGSGIYWDDWKSAVDATDGETILYNGVPIQALYSSSSGGHTEHNENVWGGTPLPYLRGVPDGPDDVDANPNHTWRVEMSWGSFEDKLQAAYGIGNLREFKLVRPLGVSGRVTVVKPNNTGGAKVIGSNKTERVDGWSLRSALSLKDTLFRVEFRYPTGSRFEGRHAALGGAPGDATSDPYDVPRAAETRLGIAQDFVKGRMTWTAATDKVTWQWGQVLSTYDATHREGGHLGMPVSGIRGSAGSHKAYYANGAIYQNPELDRAFALFGEIATLYRELDEDSSACMQLTPPPLDSRRWHSKSLLLRRCPKR